MKNIQDFIHAYPPEEKIDHFGGYVKQHPNQNKVERENNLKIGIFLAKLGFKVWLLPVSNEPGVRSADAWLEDEGIFIEFKECHTPTASAIDNAIQKAKKQAPYILLEIKCEIFVEKIIDGVENRCLRPENKDVIEAVWLIWKNELWKFSMKSIISKQWREALKIK